MMLVPKMRSIATVFIFCLFAFSACAVSEPRGPAAKDHAAPHVMQDRGILIAALRRHQILNPQRQTVHVSHSCDLVVDGERFAVVDVRELVHGAQVARGVNHIVVLDGGLKPVQSIEYTVERPLYCWGNQLFVYGDLMIDGLLPEGNVLTFEHGAKTLTISKRDGNTLPGGVQ